MTTISPPAQPAPQTLTRTTKIAFGLGDVGAAVVTNVTGFFLTAFLLDVAGLRPGAVAIIFLISQVWDAITDPIVGNLCDRTRTRWGSKRPWLLFGAVPFGVAYVLHWAVPPLDDNGLFVYYLVVALLLKTTFTIVNVPYTALTPELTDDYDERTQLNLFRFTFSIGSGLIAVVLHPTLVGLGGDNVLLGYLISAGVWGAITAITVLIAFRFTYERHYHAETGDTPALEQPGIIAGMRVAFSNRPFLYVVGIYIISWVCLLFIQNNLLLYIRYWAGAEESFTLFVLILQVTAIVFLSIWERVTGRIGKQRVYIYGVLIWVAALVMLYFVPPNTPTPYYILTAIAGVGIAVAYLIPWSMLPDVVEYAELQTGERREGVYYGMFVFLQKLGLTMGLVVSNLLLEAAGYVNPDDIAGVVEQPEAVLTTLRLMVSLIPAGILLLSLPLAYFYPITRERFAEIQAELKVKRGG